MAQDQQTLENQSMAALFGGIVVDLQQLAEQQLQLAKSEVEDDLRRRATSVKIFICIVATLFLAAINFCFALVHILHGPSSSASNDSGGFSLWSSHLIVALILVGIAGILTGLEQARKLKRMFRDDETSRAKEDAA